MTQHSNHSEEYQRHTSKIREYLKAIEENKKVKANKVQKMTELYVYLTENLDWVLQYKQLRNMVINKAYELMQEANEKNYSEFIEVCEKFLSKVTKKLQK